MPGMNDLPIIWPPAGTYLLAVSGGADSMALLHLMATAAPARGYQLIVGHVDHGLRLDAAADRHFVMAAATQLGLSAAWYEARLKPGTSEAAARTARHGWLEAERQRRGAAATLTAHHQDDVIETSLLNMARGAGRRGLAPMDSGPIGRPLRHVRRDQLRGYLHEHGLTWHEDSTNADLTNPRNLLRQRLLPNATDVWRSRYLAALDALRESNQAADEHLMSIVGAAVTAPGQLSWHWEQVRSWSIAETVEILAAGTHLLRPGHELNRRLLNELAVFAKTARYGRRRPITPGLWLERGRNNVVLRDFPLPQI